MHFAFKQLGKNRIGVYYELWHVFLYTKYLKRNISSNLIYMHMYKQLLYQIKKYSMYYILSKTKSCLDN
jgi:hypothetical protein